MREIALDGYHNRYKLPRSIVVPDSVRVITSLSAPYFMGIHDNASPNNASPIALQLGKGVERIGTEAFRSLHLDSLVIPDSVKVIEPLAFFNSRVRSLVLGTGLHTIGDRAFQ